VNICFINQAVKKIITTATTEMKLLKK